MDDTERKSLIDGLTLLGLDESVIERLLDIADDPDSVMDAHALAVAGAAFTTLGDMLARAVERQQNNALSELESAQGRDRATELDLLVAPYTPSEISNAAIRRLSLLTFLDSHEYDDDPVNLMAGEQSLWEYAKTITDEEIVRWADHIEYVSAGNEKSLWDSLTRRQVIDLLLDAQSTVGASDSFDCVICGLSRIKSEGVRTLEHIIPKADLGDGDLLNHAISCNECNSLKGSRYSIDGTRRLLINKGKDVNEEVANDVMSRVHRLRILIKNFEYIVEYYIDPDTRELLTERETLSITEDEHMLILIAAVLNDMSLSDYIRRALSDAINRTLGKDVENE